MIGTGPSGSEERSTKRLSNIDKHNPVLKKIKKGELTDSYDHKKTIKLMQEKPGITTELAKAFAKTTLWEIEK